MSYLSSLAMQRAVFTALEADPTLPGLVHDSLPPGPVPDMWVMIGDEDVRDRSDVTGRASLHQFTVSVLGDAPGFAEIKRIAGTVCDVLDGSDLSLEQGHLTHLRFDRARARRAGRSGGLRRIDLRFAARLDET